MKTKTLEQPRRTTTEIRAEADRFDAAMHAIGRHIAVEIDRCANCGTDDERLIHIFNIASRAGSGVLISENGVGSQRDSGRRALIENLKALAAFTFTWLDSRLGDQGNASLQIVEMIWCERQRQRRLLREGKFDFTCASPIVDARRKFRVLAEEIGEVAAGIGAVERASRHDRAQADHDLTSEIVQVTAVAVAWLESLLAEARNSGKGRRMENSL